MAEKFTPYQQAVKDSGTIVPYPDFCTTYHEKNGGDGWIGRKVTAIPMALFHGTISPLYHLTQALWTLAKSIYQAILQSPEVRKAFNTVDQDFFKAWGYFTTVLSDCYGLYWVESSSHQQIINRKGTVDIPADPPPPAFAAPPPAPPPPDFKPLVNKPLRRIRRTNSMVDMSPLAKEKRGWKAASLVDIQSALANLKKAEDRVLAEVELSPGAAGQKLLRQTLAQMNAVMASTPEFGSRTTRSPSSWDEEDDQALSSPYKPPPTARRNLLKEFEKGKEPVVLSDAIGAGEGTGLNLAGRSPE